MNLEHIIVTFF